MLTIVLPLATDDDEMPGANRHQADCGCACWISPSSVAARLAMDTRTTCATHNPDPDDQPIYSREVLERTLGAPMADRLVRLAARRMKEGLPL